MVDIVLFQVQLDTFAIWISTLPVLTCCYLPPERLRERLALALLTFLFRFRGGVRRGLQELDLTFLGRELLVLRRQLTFQEYDLFLQLLILRWIERFTTFLVAVPVLNAKCCVTTSTLARFLVYFSLALLILPVRISYP